MKTLAAMMIAAALFGGAQLFHEGDGESGAAASETSPLSGAYRLVANGDGAACIVTRGAELSDGLSQITVGADCRSLLPGLEHAKFWREQEDGTVALSENGVDPILSFGIADGVGYESFEPRRPLISLAVSN